jgi:hypothetical protein
MLAIKKAAAATSNVFFIRTTIYYAIVVAFATVIGLTLRQSDLFKITNALAL